ncbi:MAG: L,D-transpeptidase family protein [Chitinophagaceae bacterium]
MKNLFSVLSIVLLTTTVFAQTSTPSTFIDFQKTLPRPGDALKRKEDTLQKQFQAKGLVWPARYIYIRSFKYDSQLEIWVKNNRKEQYKLFKTYPVCALAGSLGPKRMEGDYQVPEGFYYINEFNPRSNYHLSLGLNYPNASDRLLSDAQRPGGDIYIHGSCVTVGCIPVMDAQIEEIYILAAHAKNKGQDFIPVHIFPIRFNNKRSIAYLAQLTKSDPQLKMFAETLESVYDHFEITRQLPVIMTNSQGNYIFSGLSKKVPPPPPPPRVKRVPDPHRFRNITNIADVINIWPEFPGGGENFLKYLQTIGKAVVSSLPQGTKKAYVQVEFIIDVDGTPVNFKIVKGVNEDFDDKLLDIMEKMPVWKPAILQGDFVAKKIKQTFAIE